MLLLTLGAGFAMVSVGTALRFGGSDGVIPFPLVAAGTIAVAISLIFGNSLKIKQKSPIR